MVRFVLGRACIYASATTTEAYEGASAGRVLPVTLGWIGPPIDKPSYDNRERIALEDAVLVLLAGSIGEARHRGQTVSVPQEPEPAELSSLSTDMRTTLAYVRALTLHEKDLNAFPALLAQLHHRAVALVDESWAIIEGVAQELIQRGEMGGRELEETIYRVAGYTP